MKKHMPNFEVALNIIVEKDGKEYRADAKALPGTPPVGIGKTPANAKYNLCINLLYMIACHEKGDTGGNNGYVPIILNILKKDMEDLGSPITF